MSLKHSSAVFCAHAAILDVYNNISLIFLQHLYNNTNQTTQDRKYTRF